VSNTNPTPSQILAALRDHGVDVQTYKGWDTVGRPWRGPDGSPGLTGSVVHHTATASATGTKGAPSLYWAVTAYDKPVCNLLVGRGPGDTYLLSGGSAYHCGDGGPVPALGIPSRGFLGQTRLWGIEIDDPGNGTTMTPYQVENVGRTLAALTELCGWDPDKAIGTHKCYTDGCHGWNPNGPSQTVGRKNDTMDGAWRQYPGDPLPKPYNAPFWRQETKRFLKKAPLWDGTVPAREAVLRAVETGKPSKAAWRLAARLYDLGVGEKPAGIKQQTYPAKAIAEMQAKWGWKPTGAYGERFEKRLWNKAK
jgi:hypothetical protein